MEEENKNKNTDGIFERIHTIGKNDVATYLVLNGLEYYLKLNERGYVDFVFNNEGMKAKKLKEEFFTKEKIEVDIKEWIRIHSRLTKECKDFKKNIGR